MPYKAVGVWVMKEENGKWVQWKKHKTHGEAKAQAAAVNIAEARKRGDKIPEKK